MTGRNPRFSATILWQLHKSQRQKADEEGVKAVKDATAGALAHYLEGMLRELDEQEAVLLAAAGDYARAGHEAFSVESLATHCPVLALLRGSEVLSGLLDRLVKRWLLEGMGEGRYSFASTLLATLASNLPALDELLRADLRRTCRAFPLRALPDVLEHLGIRATEGQSQATDGARDLRRLSQVAGHWRVLCRATDRRSPVAGRPGPSLLSAIRELLGTERTAWHAKDDLLLEEHDLSAVGRAMPDRVCFFVRLGDQPERSEFDGLTKRIEGAAADVGVVAADGSKLPQTVVFLLTADQGGSYRAYLSQQPGNHIVVLSGDELKELFLGADPTDYLIKRLVSGQIGIQGLIPYETQAPVSARMFFGRRDVLNRILGNVGRGYAIYGPRRIGKTSLLRRVADRLKETKAAHPVFIDCAALGKGDLGWVILNRIGLRGRQYYQSQGLEESLRHLGELRGKPVVLLLDEVDSLLARDRGQGWHILYALRQAMNDEHCAVVVAGYRELFKERSDLNSPLFNFLEPVPLDKLAEDAARGLILEPMRDMRLEFEDSEAFIERVLHLSGSLPSLIQLFCRGVTERLFAGKRYFATAADVDEVLAEDDVRRSLLTTFQGNTTKLEQLLCNLVVGRLPVDEVGVHEILNEHLDVGFDEVSQACANLWMANIISRDPDDELSFASGAMEKVVLRSAKRQIGVLLKELRRTRGN